MIACGEQLRQRRGVPLVGEEDVEEAGPGHLGSLDVRESAGCFGERLRDLAWWLPALAGEPQRDVRRVVAVRRVRGPLERDGGAGGVRERGRERRDGITCRSFHRRIVRRGRDPSLPTRPRYVMTEALRDGVEAVIPSRASAAATSSRAL